MWYEPCFKAVQATERAIHGRSCRATRLEYFHFVNTNTVINPNDGESLAVRDFYPTLSAGYNLQFVFMD